jgi:hypothetical protein
MKIDIHHLYGEGDYVTIEMDATFEQAFARLADKPDEMEAIGRDIGSRMNMPDAVVTKSEFLEYVARLRRAGRLVGPEGETPLPQLSDSEVMDPWLNQNWYVWKPRG